MIMKALVELDGPRSQPFQAFAEQRAKWELHDMYRAPGRLLLLLLLCWCAALRAALACRMLLLWDDPHLVVCFLSVLLLLLVTL